jgi:hypothetical protein
VTPGESVPPIKRADADPTSRASPHIRPIFSHHSSVWGHEGVTPKSPSRGLGTTRPCRHIAGHWQAQVRLEDVLRFRFAGGVFVNQLGAVRAEVRPRRDVSRRPPLADEAASR